MMFAGVSVCLRSGLGVESEGDDPLDWLRNSIPGEPGVDYPVLASVQETSFTCDGLTFGGYYADPEQQCQAYHSDWSVSIILSSDWPGIPRLSPRPREPRHPLPRLLPLPQRDHLQSGDLRL